MICKKIIYKGNFNQKILEKVYDITRKNEITGEIRNLNSKEIHLNLEGDPSFIKLIQHQIENEISKSITEKTVSHLDYQNFKGLSFYP